MEMLTQAFDELCFGDSETSCLIQARREHGAQTGGGGSYLSVAKNRLMKELQTGKTVNGVALTAETRQKKEERLAEIEELLKLPPQDFIMGSKPS